MKKIWISVVTAGVVIAATAGFYFSADSKAVAGPVVVEDIQYPFDKVGGLLHISVEDVFIGLGMLTGERKKGDTWTTLTGTLSFEMASHKGQVRIQIDRIRLIERTAEGKDGRVFEPLKVDDAKMSQEPESGIQFPKEEGGFPFVWESGANGRVSFVFEDFPLDIAAADLVITYNGKFPGKKHTAYYEDRFPVKRKTYLRG